MCTFSGHSSSNQFLHCSHSFFHDQVQERRGKIKAVVKSIYSVPDSFSPIFLPSHCVNTLALISFQNVSTLFFPKGREEKIKSYPRNGSCHSTGREWTRIHAFNLNISRGFQGAFSRCNYFWPRITQLCFPFSRSQNVSRRESCGRPEVCAHHLSCLIHIRFRLYFYASNILPTSISFHGHYSLFSKGESAMNAAQPRLFYGLPFSVNRVWAVCFFLPAQWRATDMCVWGVERGYNRDWR